MSGTQIHIKQHVDSQAITPACRHLQVKRFNELFYSKHHIHLGKVNTNT